MGGEIFVVTGSGQGHLRPCVVLCTHLASRNYHTTLVIPSSLLASSLPPSFAKNPFISIVRIAGSYGPPTPRFDSSRRQATDDLKAHLAGQPDALDQAPPLCAIIDFHMGWTKGVFWDFNIPVIGLFTFGACAASMEWGAWKVRAGDIESGETRMIPGLPEEMALVYSDLKRRPNGPPSGNSQPTGPNRSIRGGGPPSPGDQPPWISEIEGSIALMFNTCDDLERPFIEYMTTQMSMPVWGVGPLLPEHFSKLSDSLVHDREIREHARQSNYTEDEVIQWLDSKPHRSVLYVAFGSQVGPTVEEHHQLAKALEESTHPFIWVIQPGSGIPKPGSDDYAEGNFPHELEGKVSKRGLTICGWAPQLLILSHPSTGGFLSHCGWNSTLEAIGLGVPLLAWPIRGDQYYNAKLVVSYLKVGYRVAEDLSEMVKKEDILEGIERLMGDKEMRKCSMALRGKFEHGFPRSSLVALDAFGDFITKTTLHK